MLKGSLTDKPLRSRIDWKYVLALPLDDPGFDASVLCEFRARLLQQQAEHLLFDTLLDSLRTQGWLRRRGRQRSDSTHVLAAIRALNRLECVGATMRHALNSLAVVVPQWLLAHRLPEWAERYGPRFEDYRLPESKSDRQALAEVIGNDGFGLLEAIRAPDAPSWLGQVPAVETQVWIQNYTCTEQGTLRWRSKDELPPSGQFINSPYDAEARYSKKRSTSWVGYKVFLTESCEADLPHLITNVETRPATTPDEVMMETIHQSLEERDLLPAVHLADAGFIDAELLVDSAQHYQVDLYGPARGDCQWQAGAGQGFAAADFTIDWERQRAICPAGSTSISWTPAIDNRTAAVVKVKFSMRDCKPCLHRVHCQRALLERVSEDHAIIKGMSPREFEVLVAHTLKRIGFSRVTLRRYSKDDGADIIAVIASSSHEDELVVVEVKHGRGGITLGVLDRLNGVRDRLKAQRALAITSAHVTRIAQKSYQCKSDVVAAKTFTELIGLLQDSDDWARSPRGLWTKKRSKKI